MEEVCTSTRVKESLPIESDESASSSSSSASRLMSWQPRPLSFHPYSPIPEINSKPQSLRVVVRKPLVARLTKDIVEIYQQCDPRFRYSEEYNPKGFLTSPSIGLLNDGLDNAKSDLILSVNYSLVNSEKKRRYIVKGILGQGTFGQVAKCWLAETKTFVAVKIIKNSPAYYQQAVVEVSILSKLNETFDPEDKHHIVRMYDYFKYQNHLCIVFELLDTNLYELIKLTHFRGLSLSIVQLFSKQLLRGLTLMKDAAIIHCDLKPENIMLSTSVKPAEIKIIDFGSACMEHHTVYSYIQSRYYRSPEVVLGYQYTTAIDMWSFGCIVAELFLGLPLFPGASEFDLLRRMIKILGNQPPDYILRKAKNTTKFFKFVGSFSHEERDLNHRSNSMFRALVEEEYSTRESSKPSIGKEYFNNMNLEAIVTKFPYRKNLADDEIAKETQMRLALIDFLRGLVEFDPAKRWSPLQPLECLNKSGIPRGCYLLEIVRSVERTTASKHPFVTGEPFAHPYKPAQETPHMPVSQNFKVDHHPAGGHWFAAGLSPNVSGRTRTLMPSSPHYQLMSYANSYGSLGSHGSYNDNLAPGSSYGSYGDGSNFHAFYSPAGPSGMNFYAQSGVSVLGSSPDTRRIMQMSHSNGIGFSPGNLVPMSLGSSPSQFTPPSSFGQISAGSPGHYGPPSPVRGNCHGSPLGKMASSSHYNRRKNWPHHANIQSQDAASSSSCPGQVADPKIYSQSEGNSSVLVGSPLHGRPNASSSTRRPQQGGRSTSGFPALHTQNIQGSGSDKSEASNPLPDPGDWDPNYSEELLLQEDNSEVSSMTSEFNKGMHLKQSFTPNETLEMTRRPGLISNAFVSTQRYHGSAPDLPFGEVGANPESHGHSHMTSKSYLPPHVSLTSPSRLGQQPNQRHNFGRSVPFREGRRGNYLVSNAPPAFHGRKDYGRST